MIVTRQMAEKAATVMGLMLDNDPPDESRVNARYREMAKDLHPDRGGNPAMFVELDRAKCILIEWIKRPKVGQSADASIPIDKCLQCGGAGRRKVQRGFRSMTIVCGSCRGTGERVAPEKVEE